MGKVDRVAEAIQGGVAIALIGAYTVLTYAGKPADHLDLGIVAIMGVYFSGKVTQGAVNAVKDVLSNTKSEPATQPTAAQPPPGASTP